MQIANADDADTSISAEENNAVAAKIILRKDQPSSDNNERHFLKLLLYSSYPNIANT